MAHGVYPHVPAFSFSPLMKLTSYTDYTLRTLMYLGRNRDHLVTIQEIADAHLISKNHLMKVVYQLGATGLAETIRGRNGGLRLKMEPSEINIGEVVRWAESDFHIAECFAHGNDSCIHSSSCVLKGVLNTATLAFLQVLDGVTLEHLLAKEARGARKSDGSLPIRLVKRSRSAKA